MTKESDARRRDIIKRGRARTEQQAYGYPEMVLYDPTGRDIYTRNKERLERQFPTEIIPERKFTYTPSPKGSSPQKAAPKRNNNTINEVPEITVTGHKKPQQEVAGESQSQSQTTSSQPVVKKKPARKRSPFYNSKAAAIQQQLYELGYFGKGAKKSEIDGLWGKRTEAAYQKALKDGYIGRKGALIHKTLADMEDRDKRAANKEPVIDIPDTQPDYTPMPDYQEPQQMPNYLQPSNYNTPQPPSYIDSLPGGWQLDLGPYSDQGYMG